MGVKQQLLIIGMIFFAGSGLRAQTSVDGINYVNSYKDLAVSEMRRTGVPAAITLAQGIHESEAGTSELVRQSNNHFGIKCKDEWTGDRVYHDDDARGECFRKYASAEDSYKDHSDFLKNRPYYAALFQLDPSDYEGWAYGLKKAGYATNPKYAPTLIKIIEDYNLQQYSLIAMGKMKVGDEVVLKAPGADASPLRDATAAAAGGTRGEGGGSRPSPPEAGSGTHAGAVASPAPAYPPGEFQINRTRVVFAKSGTSLLALANVYEISLPKLLEFNDMHEEDVLTQDQLVFLQRKRKSGSIEYHLVRDGESLYDICQAEGIRLQEMLEMNFLRTGDMPAAGEKIYLQGRAPAKPLISAAGH